MKLIITLPFLYLASTFLLQAEDSTAAPKTPKDKVSYSIGVNLGSSISKSMKRDGVDVNPAMLARGMTDAMTGATTAMTAQEMTATMDSFKSEMQQKMAAAQQAQSDAGKAFLDANKKKKGVVTLPSGLQYKILTQGTGAKPKGTDSVVTNYRGTLVDGTEFDSSAKHGSPATFQVDQVIKGWTEALQLMPVGSKWQLYIPADLAYGENGPPGIGANATLVFDVELLSIKDAKSAAPDKAAP